jgi:hypothetical protein
VVEKRKILAFLTFSLICGSLLTSCGSQSASRPLWTSYTPKITDIQGRLEKATGRTWKDDGLLIEEMPEGFIQSLSPLTTEQCNIAVFVYRTDEQAFGAKYLNGDFFSTIWELEDPQTKYGIVIGEFKYDLLGEFSGPQKCTMDVAAAFNATLTR